MNAYLSADNPITREHLDRLHSVVGPGPVLILTHNGPDPDAMASGKALATLFKVAWNVSSSLKYSGIVARAENKAMLEHLTPEWEHIDSVTNLDSYSAVVLVDTQPLAGNNSLPSSYRPQIVIDHHHPVREALEDVPFVDVRPEIGATTTMVYQYLIAAGVVPDSDLATAIFYGVQTDTRGLARGASLYDEAAYMRILPLINRRKLIQVEQAGLSREYFRAFNQGLQAAQIHGKTVISYLGAMPRPDMAAEIADVLIRLESAQAALCLGYHDHVLNLSLRIESYSMDAGLLVQDLVRSLGKAGGHGAMAAGQVSLEDRETEEVVAEIQRRFLALMGETPSGIPLLSS